MMFKVFFHYLKSVISVVIVSFHSDINNLLISPFFPCSIWLEVYFFCYFLKRVSFCFTDILSLPSLFLAFYLIDFCSYLYYFLLHLTLGFICSSLSIFFRKNLRTLIGDFPTLLI